MTQTKGWFFDYTSNMIWSSGALQCLKNWGGNAKSGAGKVTKKTQFLMALAWFSGKIGKILKKLGEGPLPPQPPYSTAPVTKTNLWRCLWDSASCFAVATEAADMPGCNSELPSPVPPPCFDKFGWNLRYEATAIVSWTIPSIWSGDSCGISKNVK